MRRFLLALLVLTLLIPSAAVAKKKDAAKDDAEEEDKGPLVASTFTGLKFRSIGPALESGRIGDIAVDPNDRSRYFVAVAEEAVELFDAEPGAPRQIVEPAVVRAPGQHIAVELVAPEYPIGGHAHHRHDDQRHGPRNRPLRRPDVHHGVHRRQDAEYFEYEDKAYDHCHLPLSQRVKVLANMGHCQLRW